MLSIFTKFTMPELFLSNGVVPFVIREDNSPNLRCSQECTNKKTTNNVVALMVLM